MGMHLYSHRCKHTRRNRRTYTRPQKRTNAETNTHTHKRMKKHTHTNAEHTNAETNTHIIGWRNTHESRNVQAQKQTHTRKRMKKHIHIKDTHTYRRLLTRDTACRLLFPSHQPRGSPLGKIWSWKPGDRRTGEGGGREDCTVGQYPLQPPLLSIRQARLLIIAVKRLSWRRLHFMVGFVSRSGGHWDRAVG